MLPLTVVHIGSHSGDGDIFYGYVLKVELAALADDLDIAVKRKRHQR